MLISAEIAESDPNFRNCPQYRKSQLFLNYLFADPSLLEIIENVLVQFPAHVPDRDLEITINHLHLPLKKIRKKKLLMLMWPVPR